MSIFIWFWTVVGEVYIAGATILAVIAVAQLFRP